MLVQEYTVAIGNSYVLASIVNAVSSPYLNTAPIPGHVCAHFCDSYACEITRRWW